MWSAAAGLSRWLNATPFFKSPLFKVLVHLACAAPGAALIYDTFWGDLGINPLETLLHETGRNALAILLITLTVTPVRRLLSWNRLQSVRRMLGLWAFAYGLTHFSIYFLLDQACIEWSQCRLTAVLADLVKRKFIFAGMVSLSIMLLLALTSTTGWIRRLGRNWQRLHRLVYVAAISGVVHFIWKQKSDYTEPTRWAVVLAVLLGIRIWFAVKKHRAATARA